MTVRKHKIQKTNKKNQFRKRIKVKTCGQEVLRGLLNSYINFEKKFLKVTDRIKRKKIYRISQKISTEGNISLNKYFYHLLTRSPYHHHHLTHSLTHVSKHELR